MSHFGVLSFKGMGHLNPLIALSRKLVDRGHRVTFFLDADMEHYIHRHGLEFVTIAVTAYSSVSGYEQKPSSGVAALRYRCTATCMTWRCICETHLQHFASPASTRSSSMRSRWQGLLWRSYCICPTLLSQLPCLITLDGLLRTGLRRAVRSLRVLKEVCWRFLS